MIGGTVIETIVLDDKVWINCEDRHKTTCAIYVERTPRSRSISDGDTVWWQGDRAFWTPKPLQGNRQGIDFDIILKRRGYSGVSRPITQKDRN